MTPETHTRLLCLQINTCPKDKRTTAGAPFWSGTKRFPTPATLDVTNDNHVTFIVAMANILAAAFGLVRSPDVYVSAGALAASLSHMLMPATLVDIPAKVQVLAVDDGAAFL